MSYIELKNVTKVIKKKRILDSINLDIEKASIVALVGANGSGKTMLLRAIAGFINIEGEIFVNGKKVNLDTEYPESLGIIIENSDMIPEYTGLENLKYLASINGKFDEEKVYSYMKRFEIYENKDDKMKSYSLGMKKKIEIIQAIMEGQRLILLDEPTNALDKKAISEFYKIVKELKNEGKTIIIASHSDDILKVSDVVVEMYEGKIVEVRRNER